MPAFYSIEKDQQRIYFDLKKFMIEKNIYLFIQHQFPYIYVNPLKNRHKLDK